MLGTLTLLQSVERNMINIVHDEFEVDIINIDEENDAEVDVTVDICGWMFSYLQS